MRRSCGGCGRRGRSSSGRTICTSSPMAAVRWSVISATCTIRGISGGLQEGRREDRRLRWRRGWPTRRSEPTRRARSANRRALCGCVGLKPTYGRVSSRGVIPLSPSLDHVGPDCRERGGCGDRAAGDCRIRCGGSSLQRMFPWRLCFGVEGRCEGAARGRAASLFLRRTGSGSRVCDGTCAARDWRRWWRR